MFALIDDDDYELVKWHKWRAQKGKNTFYAATNLPHINGKRTGLLMHRLILGLTDPKIQGDHKNRNGLDNRRENLRACTHGQNQQNSCIYKNNTSGFKGVTWDKSARKWRSYIKFNSKGKHLGLFETPEAAHEAYCKAAAELHGEFSNTGD